MIGTTKSTAFWHPLAQWNDHDASWYGTIWVLTACLGVLATFCFWG